MEDKLINNWNEFYEEVQNGELYDNLIYQDDYQGKNFYVCNTNGNDLYYQLYLFVDETTVYWGDAILTEDDIERDGQNASPEWDEYMYKYSDFPIDVKKLNNWVQNKIKKGIDEGWNVIKNYDPFKNLPVNSYVEWEGEKLWKMNIPDYALPLLINNDDSGLEQEDIETILKWEQKFNIKRIEPTDETNEFDVNPAFGEPCATTLCKVYE